MLRALLGDELPVRFEFWDGSALGPARSVGTLHLRSADALRRILWAPGELGFARAFVVGDIDVTGPVPETLRALQTSMPDEIGVGVSALPATIVAARELGAIGTPLPPPDEELVPRGLRHSIGRDKRSVGHHYDVGNDFYRLVLGEAMTYSCARFVTSDTTLPQAQAAKHELICRKLGLADPEVRAACDGDRPRLLDVGCGWGTMAMHAAAHHDVDVVGVTISDEQAALARRRVGEAGLAERVEIRIQDYREITDGPFDAISSIGMAEHVGEARMDEYFERLHELLRPHGRVMNHAIASFGGSRLSRSSFVGRYIFPDGELFDLGDTVAAMHRAGLEVRDVENLREHYARTLRCWVDNLEARWDDAVALVGERRARAWLLYMGGSVNGFDDAGLQLFQTLGVRDDGSGASAMAPTRRSFDPT
ncbi:class I SAM-dependent methyltransferase [Ilumatobacter sp.]|uniref:class I SAM-dependent methyltransferase n=1 Tax=Ilumatobacter sp. TaxID=1967498 RepID=UPI003B52E911